MKHLYTCFSTLLLTLLLFFLPSTALADVDYLTITANPSNTTNTTIKIGRGGGYPNTFNLSYKLDTEENWTDLSITSEKTIASLAPGHSIMFKGNNSTTNGIGNRRNGGAIIYWYFDIKQKVSLSGNIMSLIDENAETTTIKATTCCFYRLFQQDSITDISNLKLPATTLTDACYEGMFYNCKPLRTVMDNLPATTLASNCYKTMFDYCPITTAPALPATTLEECCYYQMFAYCKNLIHAPSLPATTLAKSCYFEMFNGCTALETAPKLPATTLATDCYNTMFNGCTSLTKAPSELPATTLVARCYKQMFKGCTALETAPVIKAASLPANNTEDAGCMEYMFQNCSSLKNLKVYFTEWHINTSKPKKEGTYYWMDGTTLNNSTCTFLCPCALSDARSSSRILSNWTRKCFYTYTFDVATNGGTLDGSDAAHTIDRVSDETLSELPEAQKTNYHFKGWYTTSSGAGSKLEIANQTDFNADYTFYARFDTAFTFNVATNGGTWDGTSSTANVIYSLETLPSNPQKEDCNFTGWFTTANDDSETGVQLTGDNKNSFTTNTTFYARFEAATPPEPEPDPEPDSDDPQQDVVELDDTQDNTALLTDLEGNTVNVLLAGRTLVGGCANTLCLPFGLTAKQLAESPLSGCTIWEFGSSTFDGETLHIDANVATEIEAGKPYLVEPAAAVQNLRFEGVTISASTGTELGNNAVRFVGILSPFTMTAGSEDQLFVGAGNKLLRPSSTSALRGFRAWFKLNDGPAQAAPRAKLTFGEKPQVPTGLDNTEKDNSPRKISINGQLYITHDGATYTPAGNVMPK